MGFGLGKRGYGRLALACAGLLAVAGCKEQRPEADSFFPEQSGALSRQVLEAQAQRGAREDATLYPQHFDGAELNDLGRAKLGLMVRDNSTALPVVVYVDLPEKDGRTAGRRDAVKRWLGDAGLLAGQYRLESGANPATLHPIAPELAKLNQGDEKPGGAPPVIQLSPGMGDMMQPGGSGTGNGKK